MNLKNSLKDNMKRKVLVIIGQTAVGKTKLSIKLAKQLNGQIINISQIMFISELFLQIIIKIKMKYIALIEQPKMIGY